MREQDKKKKHLSTFRGVAEYLYGKPIESAIFIGGEQITDLEAILDYLHHAVIDDHSNRDGILCNFVLTNHSIVTLNINITTLKNNKKQIYFSNE